MTSLVSTNSTPNWLRWEPACRSGVKRSEGLLVERLQAAAPRLSGQSADRCRARERYRVASSKGDVFDAFTLADTLCHEHAH